MRVCPETGFTRVRRKQTDLAKGRVKKEELG